MKNHPKREYALARAMKSPPCGCIYYYLMTDLTKIRRAPHKANSDPEVARKIIETAKVAHVAMSLDDQPFSIPVACAPYGQEVLVHGSTASRLFKALASGVTACLTITHVDALVLARSSFQSSLHYRSIMAFGVAIPASNLRSGIPVPDYIATWVAG